MQRTVVLSPPHKYVIDQFFLSVLRGKTHVFSSLMEGHWRWFVFSPQMRHLHANSCAVLYELINAERLWILHRALHNVKSRGESVSNVKSLSGAAALLAFKINVPLTFADDPRLRRDGINRRRGHSLPPDWIFIFCLIYITRSPTNIYAPEFRREMVQISIQS